MRLDGGGMFGVVPKAIWQRLAPPDDANRIELQTNCLLLRCGGRTVLVETGCGDKWTDKQRAIFAIERRTVVDALGECGVDPSEVDDVIVTHLHFDHAGALTTSVNESDPTPTFANASVHVQEQEWSDALAGRSTMTGTYLRSHLDPIADRVVLHEGDGRILPGIHVLPVPGHTWGQQAVLIDTEAGAVCFPGDLLPTCHHVGAPYSMGYDMLPWQNMRTKRSLLARAAAEAWTLVLDHEPGHPVFKVRSSGDWFELVPQPAG